MPENKGRQPPHEFVDVIFRNGTIKRAIKSADWRWKPWDFEADFDIMRWQKSFDEKKSQ